MIFFTFLDPASVAPSQKATNLRDRLTTLGLLEAHTVNFSVSYLAIHQYSVKIPAQRSAMLSATPDHHGNHSQYCCSCRPQDDWKHTFLD